MTTANDNLQLRTAADQPNVREMAAQLSAAVTNASTVIATMLANENTRNCAWPDQQDDGRKPKLVNGREAEPWPGASDVRIRLADELVNDQVKMMKVAARKAQFTFKATKGAAYETVGKVKSYLEWLRHTRMHATVRAEVELAAQWRQTHGYALMAVTWQQEWAREYQTVTIDMLQEQAAAQPGGPAAQMLAALYEPDPDVLRELGGMLRQMYADLDQGEALKQLRALQRTGEMKLPARYLRVNEPQWEALKPWRDVFFPLNMTRAQRSRWIAWRVTLTEAELQEKALSEQWDEDFIDAARKTKGQTVIDTLQQNTAGAGGRLFLQSAEQMEGLVEVFYFYYTFVDETGVPCKYRTVFSPHVTRLAGAAGHDVPAALDEPLGYDHGLFPFVELRRERPDRLMADSRGTPAVVLTQQTEAKAMRDARVNQTELVLQPPVLRPEREVGLALAIRPRGEIGQRRASMTSFMPVPNTAAAGQPLEADALADARRYFARNRAEDPVRAGLYDEDLAADWCEELSECWAQTLQLAQQFEEEVTFDRIVGGQQVNLRLTRAEIQGEFDAALLFNTDTLDPERMQAKLTAVQTLLAPLAGGVIDFGPVVRGAFAYFFPEFADDALREGAAADAAEIKDEIRIYADALAGVENDYAEKGQSFAMRLQWLQQQVQQPGAQARLAALPDSAELVTKRLQHLQFQTMQFGANAQAGRTGVMPAFAKAPEGGPSIAAGASAGAPAPAAPAMAMPTI